MLAQDLQGVGGCNFVIIIKRKKSIKDMKDGCRIPQVDSTILRLAMLAQDFQGVGGCNFVISCKCMGFNGLGGFATANLRF